MLREKIKRDISDNISQYVTIFLMIFIGLFTFTGIKCYMKGMEDSVNKYYKKNNLQDLNAYGSFTEHDLKRILEYEEVKDVNAILTLPEYGTVENKNNHKVSINFITENTVSKFYVKEGEGFVKNRKGIWIDSYYAKENNLKVGDAFNFYYDGIEFKEKILGFINVPDRVYEVKENTDILPSHDDYGYIYLSIKEIPRKIVKKLTMESMGIKDEKEFDRKVTDFHRGTYIRYTKLMIDLYDKKDYKNVKEKIEKRKNTIEVINIKDEISYKTYKNESNNGKSYMSILSVLFILIALISIAISSTRITKKYRKDIGILKALGYKKIKILFNYLKTSFKLSFWASLFGILLGYFILGFMLMKFQMNYYEVPNYRPTFDMISVYVAIFTIVLVILSSYFSTRKLLKLNIAETIRDNKFNINTKYLDKTKEEFFNKLNFSSIWNIRDIIRNKKRTILEIIGIVCCIILLICSFGIQDTYRKYLETQFEDLYNFKYKLIISNPITDENLKKIENDFGDATSEEIKIKINKEDISNKLFINDTKDYIKFIDSNGKFIKIKDNGVYITENFSKKYNYKIGDKIKWYNYSNKKYYESKIIGINNNIENNKIIINRKYYEKLKLKYEPDSLYTNKNLSKIDKIDNILLIQSINELKDCNSSILYSMKNIILSLVIIAIILSIVIIYNIGVLSYVENNYQFASLKLLGFDFKKISKIFIKQNMWITFISIIIGLPIGNKVLNYILTKSISNLYLKEFISLKSYILVIFIMLITSYLISLLISLKIKKIDMINILKGNE